METCSVEKCINRYISCDKCNHQPSYTFRRSFYQPYTPTCPRGYADCISDIAYLKYSSPNRYTEEELAEIYQDCLRRAKEDPDERYYCYDDEDK